jgi:hypothetical protein
MERADPSPSPERGSAVLLAPRIVVLPYRFTFRALDPLFFPDGKAANTLRGALGMGLRRASCLAHCERLGPECICPYARLFSPRTQAGPSGFADPPRPFVIRAGALDGRHFQPGGRFSFDLHLFMNDPAALLPIAQAFQVFLADGLGPCRARVELLSIEVLNEAREPATEIFSNRQPGILPHVGLVAGLSPDKEEADEVQVGFLEPTELKHEGALVERPEFFILMARLRYRIRALCELYGSGPMAIDYVGLIERARRIQIRTSNLSWISTERRSSRTTQRHPLGGFVGTVTYAGPLAEFLPWLRAGYWTGVGRQTVWGKGVIDLRYPEKVS